MSSFRLIEFRPISGRYITQKIYCSSVISGTPNIASDFTFDYSTVRISIDIIDTFERSQTVNLLNSQIEYWQKIFELLAKVICRYIRDVFFFNFCLGNCYLLCGLLFDFS
jgi:hypothetical protein